MASKMNKVLDTFNKLFVVPKRARFIDDKLHNIKKSESEKRIILGD